MGGLAGLDSALDVASEDGTPARETDFPPTVGALLDRLGSLHGHRGELERVRRVVEPLDAVAVETSVSLGSGEEPISRLTLGLRRRPEDPQARSALVTALHGLGVGRVASAVDEALASVAITEAPPPLVRAVALRVRRGGPVRPRAGGWVGGKTGPERSRRIRDALLRVGLDRPAAVHERLASELAANPFNAVFPYGLGFDVGSDGVRGAKIYVACEWPDVAVALLSGRLADDLRLDALEVFGLLATSARADIARPRWQIELSFELPADPARGVRAKAYLRADGMAANEAEGHAKVLRLAAALGLDPGPYKELVKAVRPDGLSAERSSSIMAGVSASARGRSLEVYLFDPDRPTRNASRDS